MKRPIHEPAACSRTGRPVHEILSFTNRAEQRGAARSEVETEAVEDKLDFAMLTS
jgi:hypothetical protein